MRDEILREIGKIVVPFIQVFGIYVIFNGHLSPGGGFSGGTILGVSLILHKLIEEPGSAGIKVSEKAVMRFMCFSLMKYGNITYPEAVAQLLGERYEPYIQTVVPYEKEEKGPLIIPDKAENFKRTYWYLISIRGIGFMSI